MKAGWTSKPIGDVFKVINGGTPKTGVASNWDGPHAWITPAEMGNLDTPFISESRRTLTDEGLRTGAELVPAGSIILSSRAPIGHLVINEIPMAFNQGCKGLIPSPAIDTKFAYYFLLTNVPLLESLGTGATFKELSGGKLKEVQFQFPAFAEQRRIVTLLDEAFANIATTKANAEKSLLNANELLKKVIEEKFQEALDEYGTSSLGRVCIFENGDRGKNYPGKQHRVAHGVPFINAGHLTSDGIDFSEMDYISPDRFELLGNGKIQPNDVLFCLRGSLGKFACVEDLAEGAIASSLVILRPKEELVLDYLLAYLSSSQCANQINTFKGGAAQPNLGAKDLKQFAIPLPPKNIQIEIANRLSVFKEHVNHLVSTHKEKLTALDDLKKSLLHQAFSEQL